MPDPIDIAVLSRRTFLASAAAAAAFHPYLARAENAGADGPAPSQKFKDDFARIVGSATPIEGKITVDLPETAENGNFVPMTIAADSPMTDADYIKTIHILSTENPHAHVATFFLTPVNAVARVQTRIRLAKTQNVVVLAEQSDGRMLIATTLVKVTIGGCGI